MRCLVIKEPLRFRAGPLVVDDPGVTKSVLVFGEPKRWTDIFPDTRGGGDDDGRFQFCFGIAVMFFKTQELQDQRIFNNIRMLLEQLPLFRQLFYAFFIFA